MTDGGGGDVVVTGVGVASASAIGGRQELAAAPMARPTPLDALERALPVEMAFQVPGTMSRLLKPYLKQRKSLKLMSRDARLAVLAAAHALTDAGLDPQARDRWATAPEEVGLYMGVGLEPGDVSEVGQALAVARIDQEARVDLARLGQEGIDRIPPLAALKTLPNMALAHVAINFDLMGPGEALSCWSTAGLHALAAAHEAIERGLCQVALVGAADSDVDFDGLALLIRAGLLTTPLRADPTGARDLWHAGPGWIPGEGAAFVVLESLEHAQARGVSPVARMVGTTNVMLPPRSPGIMAPEGVRRALAPLLSDRPCRVASAAGHAMGWRQAEAVGVEAARAEAAGLAELVFPGRGHGYCGCATALLDLVSLLGSSDEGDVAVVGWGPTGEYAAARLSREVR
ncbi:MAG: beta-ketoacyl synthase N-terminal-like domain-containing protein [Myxococcota bacterium]